MNRALPEIPRGSRAIAARIFQSNGWTTELDFQTPAGIRRIRFVMSSGWAPLEAFLNGFDVVEIADANSERNGLEFGRYLVKVITDGDAVGGFAADAIIDVSDQL